MRATLADLHAAEAEAGGPLADESSDESLQPARAAGDALEVASEIPPRLPSRVAGRPPPAAPLSRRRPKRSPRTLGEVEYHVGFVPRGLRRTRSTPAVAPDDEALPPETPAPVAVRPAPAPSDGGSVPDALRWPNSRPLLPANGDDFSFRRR